jgi:enoyl-CoA hydratase/carnithine racemase
MAPAGPVLVERGGGLLQLRLARPEARNALTAAMYDRLRGALAEAAGDPTVRAVLLSAEGRAFCAGNDRAGFAAVRDLAPDERPGWRFMQALAAFPKPVVAAVAGPAVGLGATLLLHCDLVYADPGASLRLPFTRLGLVPEFAASYLLPRLAGHARAAEWLLLGEPIDAAAAREAGLVTAVVAQGDVLAHARAVATRLAALPAEAVAETRRLMRAATAAPVAAAMHTEMAVLSRLLRGPEAARLIDRPAG